MADSDAPGDGATDSAAGGSGGDDAAWQDLVARFDAPSDVPGDSVPWPEREDLADSVPAVPAGPDSLPGAPDPLRADPPAAQAPAAQTGHGTGAARGPRDTVAPEDPEDEHYIPPVPPPLPKLNRATKLAWLALFAGPAYLLLSTVMGWPVTGLTAFLCIAAFVGGFAAIVIRMDNGGPRDSGPDNGAVV